MTDDALASAGRILDAARSGLDAAMNHARAAAIKAHTKGLPETVIAKKLGVNRLTVRRWLGK